MSQRDYIPIDVDDLPEIFEIELADITFNFGVSYNAVGDFFMVDLYDEDLNPIVLGEKLVLNHRLWAYVNDDRLPAVDLVPMDESGQSTAVNAETFGRTVFLMIDDIDPTDDLSSDDYVGIGEDGGDDDGS